jgi:murein L,D-transpeptidase YafK
VLLCQPFLAHSEENVQELVPESLVSLGKGPFYSNHVFIVDKSKRTLSVWEQSEKGYEKVKEFNADFGKMSGDKVATNDYKTPEGIYFFEKYLQNVKLDFQEYGLHEVKAYPMNYPNLFDQRNGKTGYGIWLHTIPDAAPLNRGSKGCVVLRTNDFDEAAKFIKLNNTPIMVNDHVNFVPSATLDLQKQNVVAWLKKWLESWQTKNIDNYMTFYDKSFHSKGMNYKNWQQYKKGLADNYKDIAISISEPRVMHFRDEWVIEFIQKYKSDQYQDFGNKTLYVKGNINNLKIIAEDFDTTTSEVAIAQFDAGNFSCCSVGTPATATEQARTLSTKN